MIGWGLQGTVPLPAGERLVPRGEARPTGQAPSAPGCGHGFTRGRKTEGLRNRREMVGKGPGSWRTDTMRVGGGPQGSNLFHQAGRLTPSRKVENNIAKNISQKIWDLDSLNLNQVISNTGFESPCSTKGKSCRFSPPLWSNGSRLRGGNPIDFVPASRGGVYIESIQ